MRAPLIPAVRTSLCIALAAVCALGANLRAAEAQALRPQLKAFTLDRVQVGGEIGRRMDLTLRENFLKLDVENGFLKPLRERHPKEQLSGFATYIGTGILGLSAIYFALESHDPALVARKDYIIDEILKTQSPSGYIGLFTEEPNGSHLWTEYCLHETAYLIYALSEDYRLFHRDASLAGAKRLADYLLAKWPGRPPGNSYTTMGLDESYLALFVITGDARYRRFISDETMGRRFAIKPAPLSTWEQELKPRRPLTLEEFLSQKNPRATKGEQVHVARLEAKILSQIRLAQLQPGENLLLMAHRLLDAMTDPAKPAMLVTGAVANTNEVWTGTQEGAGETSETCTVTYEMWILDELIRLEGNLRYGDIMERAIYNTLFGSQDPNGRQLCYNTPFTGKREAFSQDGYCCPNNFRRAVSGLSGHLYYQSKDGLAVNLYTASTAKLELPGGQPITIRQETDYPSSGDVKIILSEFKPAGFSLRLRIPRWCANPEVSVNGEKVANVSAGAPYLEIRRTWQPGDSVRLHLPMTPRWVLGTQEQVGRVALLYGPLLYGLSPARNAGVKALRRIVIDPNSIQGPDRDDSIRPNGTLFRVKGWSPARQMKDAPDLTLTLSEFIDFGSEEVLFSSSDFSTAKPDELLGRP